MVGHSPVRDRPAGPRAEAEWSAGPTAISLVRSYTTLHKDEVGAFGHGWELSIRSSRP